MIAAVNLLWIIPASILFGFFVCAALSVSRDEKE